jgi:spore germination cell wall hydrolase CwlJ-like protein
MSLKQGISLTIRNVVVALTTGILLVLFASTNALAERGPTDLAKQHIDKIEAQSHLLYAPTPTRSLLLKRPEQPEQPVIHNKQLICLAKNVYYEAGGESAKGKAAVAHVTLNRANSPLFPDSVCNVVYQRSRSVCQFSWVCMRKAQPRKHTDRWAESLRIARQALAGQSVDPTYGALFFHAVYVKPSWSRTFKKTIRIGNHIFYRRSH